jgi:hypothetical protein
MVKLALIHRDQVSLSNSSSAIDAAKTSIGQDKHWFGIVIAAYQLCVIPSARAPRRGAFRMDCRIIGWFMDESLFRSDPPPVSDAASGGVRRGSF